MIRKTLAAAAIAAFAVTGVAAPAGAAAKTYANCTAMNKAYPHGVGKKGARDKVSGSTKPVTNFKVDTALYNANKKSDRDKDGIACEKR
ncbi:excalibur calcium-binding domain-containing protein [Actinoplanes sp. NPDC049265]|uniref:excalibur calcium-binding domain-containing protein n=1 Tax=Actinoplanes sp. NPDC049265 TaxID=3363902 RepID=UPI00371D888C